MDILARIHQKYARLTQKEQQLADYILQEGGRLQNMNISVLAARSGVSNGTVTHFCKTLECGSYAELKLELSRVHTETGQEGDSIFDGVLSYYQTIIKRTDQLVDREMLSRIVETIAHCRGKVYLYGIGSSGLTADELMLRLLRMGIHVQAITDAHLMIIESAILTAEDLVIALSISGETTEVVQAVQIARQSGCQTVSLTSFPESSLAKASHVSLSVIDTERVGRLRFINTQFSVMYVIDLMTAMLLENEERLTRMEKTVSAIITKHEK